MFFLHPPKSHQFLGAFNYKITLSLPWKKKKTLICYENVVAVWKILCQAPVLTQNSFLTFLIFSKNILKHISKGGILWALSTHEGLYETGLSVTFDAYHSPGSSLNMHNFRGLYYNRQDLQVLQVLPFSHG